MGEPACRVKATSPGILPLKLATFTANGRSSYGVVVGDGIADLGKRLKYAGVLEALRAGALAEVRQAAQDARPDVVLNSVTLLPPISAPEKILCIGVNYANRNAEYKDGSEQPKFPSMFFRTPGSLVGHGQPIVRPKVSPQLDYEGEICLVIGRQGRHIAKERAMDHVAGYTLCNEGTLRDWVRHAKFNVTQGKNFDASGSIGPYFVSADEIDPSKPLHLTTKVNGEVRQDDTTASLIFGFADLIAYITTFTTLKPGDIIVTGTPIGAGARFDPPRWLKPGDVVEVSVPGIGVLRNQVVDEA
ncbi:MAG TPA: fumarylacetoacetate hydrolase family protein [Xanthobacteraceae bacterium]|nr:fumarylacetoacetate hydrolase family protein [Xanthobacteraceae bacterium]